MDRELRIAYYHKQVQEIVSMCTISQEECYGILNKIIVMSTEPKEQIAFGIKQLILGGLGWDKIVDYVNHNMSYATILQVGNMCIVFDGISKRSELLLKLKPSWKERVCPFLLNFGRKVISKFRRK